MTALVSTERRTPVEARRPGQWWLLAILAALIPVVRLAVGARAHILGSSTDVFAYMMRDAVPIAFPVIVVVFGCLSLTWSLNHRFLVLTRTREDVTVRLRRLFLVNAAVVGAVMAATTLLAALVAYWVVPAFGLVEFRPQYIGITPEKVHAMDLANNTWSFLLAHGAPVYALVYALFVGVSGALWASLAFTLVLLVPNRYLALSLPFVIYHMGNLASGILQAPRFSPASSVFPFNITAMPLWTAFVPMTVLALVTAGLAGYCWRNARTLESLA